MKQHKTLACLFVLILAVVSLCLRLDRPQVQADESYVPSGILVSELGDEVPPGRLNVRFPPRDPVQVGEEIRRLLQQPDLDRSFAVQAVPAITAEIQTLAAGLENDPLAIYDYVYNHVEYIPSWGLLKNPRETLLAGAGNAFDQAALLSALLEAAGYETRYVWGNIRVSKTEAMNWVGASDPAIVGNIFASGGVPTTDEGSTLLMTHIWVGVSDGGWQSLDPSFKAYSEQAGQDLRSLLGYDLPTFISDAESGATITSDYVQNLNQANIRADLASYASNLINYLQSGDTFIYPEDLIGGRQIVTIESSAYPAVPYEIVSTSGTASDIPDTFAYELTIQLPGINYTVNVDDIAGERITIFYECATTADCQLLENGGGIYEVYPAYMVDVVPKLRIGGEVVATGDAVPLGSWGHQLDVTIATPISGWSPSFSQFLTAGEWYALPLRLQTVSNKALARHAALLDQALLQGLEPDDEQVLGQLLYVLGLSYFNQVDLGDQIASRLAQVVSIPHFSMMIASRNLTVWIDVAQNPVDLDQAGHTVDVQMNVASVVSAQNPANAERERAWFLSAGVRGSAVEHAIHEQLRSVPAISTIQALKLATAEGQRIYYVTSANWSEVEPLLGHPSYILSSIAADVAAGWHIIISQNPVNYCQWTGSGWISLDPASGSAAYLISGGTASITQQPLIVNGGSTVIPERGLEDPDELQEDTRKFAKIFPELTPEQGVGRGVTYGDPVDAVTGVFVHQSQDLAPLGGRGIPLVFERFYASSHNNLAGPLGYGWSHSYNTYFYTGTNWSRVLAGRTVLEAAPALAAGQVGVDLFDAATIPHQRFSMDVTIAHWLMTQITDNAVTLIEPDGTVNTFVRLSDGAYQSPTREASLDTVTMIEGDRAALDWEDGTRARSGCRLCQSMALCQCCLGWGDGTRSSFDAQGHLIASEDANGNSITLSYNGQGNLNQVTDATGRSMTLAYDSQDRLTQISDPAGHTLDYSYDAQGNLQTYTDPRGEVTTYAYDDDHHLTSVTDPLDTTYVANQYDALGRVVTQFNGRGAQTSLLYGGDRTIVTDPLGYRSTYFYDERLRLLGIQDALGNRTTISYDAADHEEVRTNPLNQTTLLEYDASGRLTTISDALGRTVAWTYDLAGNPVSYSDQRGKIWQLAYDGQRNLTSVTDPLGNVTLYTYDDQGQLTQAQGPSGVYVTYTYDEYGNPDSLTNALGEASDWDYDVVGRPTSFTDGATHTTQFSYDAGGNLLQVTDPLGQQVGYTYDANGNLIEFTNANGYATTFAYDAQFNLVGVTDALGKSTTYDYDANDNLVRITDANGHQTIYQRDPVGQLITATDPLNRDLVFDYDAAGRLLTFDRADGSRISYQHDALGRMTGIDYPTGPDVSYVYDAAGNMTQAAYDGSWSASYVYDDVGRLTTVQDAGRNLIFSYQYDLAGRRTGLRVSRDTTPLYDLVYAYDAAARLSTLTDQTGSPPAAIGFAYDAAGRMTRITDPGSAYADYVYDASGRLTQVSHRDSQGANVATYAYTYDPAGNPTAATETTPVGVFGVAYAYDALDRLTTETYPRYAIEYTFDAVGNLTRRLDPLGTLDYTYDDADQLQSRGGESFTHDQNGNLITWQNARGAYTYTYDYDNRLDSLTLPDGKTTAFTYDVFDRRLTAQGPMGEQGFVHNGLDIILQGDGDLDQALERYLYGDGLLVAGYTDRLGFTAYRGDALENVRYLLDERGQAFDAFRYDAFGSPARQAGINPTPFRFVGQRSVYEHAGLGWPVLLMGYRYYDPGSGRFFTRDPWPGNLFHPISLNDYNYAFSNPMRYNDPSGLRPPDFEGPPPGAQEALSKPNLPDYSPDARTDSPTFEEPPTPDQPAPGLLSQGCCSSASGKASMASQWSPGSSSKLLTHDLEFNFGGLGTDGISWQPVAAQGSAYALVCTDDDALLAGAFHAGLLHSADAGHADWDEAFVASVGEFAVVDANTCYAGAWYSGALKSSDGGLSWAPINDGLIANDVYALVADPASPNHLFAGTEMGLYVSHDGGENWGRPAGTLPGRLVSDLAFAGDVLVAVTDLGLYRSDDDGASWQAPMVNLPAVAINVLLVDSPAATVYAGTALGPYQSLDGGDTWAAWGTGLESERVHALAFDPADANYVVAGTTAGLFVSTNGGDTWAGDTNTGLKGTASQVGAVTFCPDGGNANLYLGVGGGVYALRAVVHPDSVTISGPVTGSIQINYTFTATVDPGSATFPITYAWEATDQGAMTYPEIGGLSHAVDFTWSTTGTKIITVSASNVGEPVTDIYTIVITGGVAPAAVTITSPTTGFIRTDYTFTAIVSPPTTMFPIAYVWEASDQDSVTHAGVHSLSDTVTFDWNTVGTKIVTVTASNASGPAVMGVHTIVISRDAYRVYLPLVVKHWPPVPFAPNLLSIDNPDQDGNYTVRWTAPAGPEVTAYELEEDGVSIESYYTSTSYPVSGQSAGTHTYRVRGRNSYGLGFWSNSQSVFIMPKTTFTSVADTFVLQGYASMNLGSESEMWAGYDDYLDPDGKIARSFVKFDLSEIPAGTSISQATLYLYLCNSWDYPGRSRTITTYRLGSTWSEMTVNWNSRPSIAEAYGSASVAHGSDTWHNFDVTALVRGWINGTWPNHGLAIRGPEHSGADSSWKSFCTRESSYAPYVRITYTTQAVQGATE